jgi:murein DD-endopeptidase
VALRKLQAWAEFLASGLCLWAAVFHTPAGALARVLYARLAHTSAEVRPLLSYFSGGAYHEAAAQISEAGVPEFMQALPPGRAIGRGVWAVYVSLSPLEKKFLENLAQGFNLPIHSPDEAAAVIDAAQVQFGVLDAAVLAAFTDSATVRFALEKCRSEGQAPTVDALARQLPPNRRGAVESASKALMWSGAFALLWPVPLSTEISSPFGFRQHPILGRGQFHTGVDLPVPIGTAVKVVADGVVLRASEDAVNGKVVIVSHGHGVSTAYCHNAQLLVSVGKVVKVGDVISNSGNTGRSTGPHVHYQLELGGRPVDPLAFRSGELGQMKPTFEGPPRPSKSLSGAFEQFGAPPENSER